MDELTPLLDYVKPLIALTDRDIELFKSVLHIVRVKRKQYIDQPGFVSRHRSFIVKGAFRSFAVDSNGNEHTISISLETGWTGDPGSFLTQTNASLYVEAIEPSEIIQWSYDAEQMLLQEIPRFREFMTVKAQQIAVAIQRRLISRLILSAEERYDEFAKEHTDLLMRIPLYIIASYLGMTREFLSKIRNQKLLQPSKQVN